MELLSDGTRRALARWDGRPRQIAALVCAALAALLALTGGSESRPEVIGRGAPAAGPAAELGSGYVAAVLPAGPASLLIAPGDHVDVYATLPDLPGAAAQCLVRDARVMSTSPNRRGPVEASGYVVLELTEQAASALAGVADARLTVVVRARDG